MIKFTEKLNNMSLIFLTLQWNPLLHRKLQSRWMEALLPESEFVFH
jgi:hypothetical protein